MQLLSTCLTSLVCCVALDAQAYLTTYDLNTGDSFRLTDDILVKGKGTREYRHRLAVGSDTNRVRAFDRASGKVLPARVDGELEMFA